MISIKKVELAKQKIKQNCNFCKNKFKAECHSCLRWEGFINQMASAEIPVDYWFRNFKGFYGSDELKKCLTRIYNDINKIYENGETLYFAGERGRGKTLSSCLILKEALLKNYSAFYITLSDMVNRIVSNDISLKVGLKNYDFLVIDEIDNRFFPTTNSMELYGGQLENVLRSRMQNKLPTIMCSNARDIELVFGGEFKKSFKSLWSQFVTTVVALGPDARKVENNET